MKKQLLLFCMILMPIVASADVVEIDGIYYELITKAKEAKVTHGEQKYEGEIVVPAEFTYNDVAYKVVSIGDGAFKACYGVTKVTLPSTITIIAEGMNWVPCCSRSSIWSSSASACRTPFSEPDGLRCRSSLTCPLPMQGMSQ